MVEIKIEFRNKLITNLSELLTSENDSHRCEVIDGTDRNRKSETNITPFCTSPPDRDLNLDLPVLSSRAQHETSALANYATEAGCTSVLFTLFLDHRKDWTSLMRGRVKVPELQLVAPSDVLLWEPPFTWHTCFLAVLFAMHEPAKKDELSCITIDRQVHTILLQCSSHLGLQSVLLPGINTPHTTPTVLVLRPVQDGDTRLVKAMVSSPKHPKRINNQLPCHHTLGGFQGRYPPTSFSSLKLLISYSRNSTKEDRLNGLHVHTSRGVSYGPMWENDRTGLGQIWEPDLAV
uniref:Uncharacterized protein n=1 Tax=Timema monikensis TaxID=170555 RepID=A0A7R9HKP6_9NEOP|nr:unnamed protein product [Timema monikensis]